MKRNIESTAPNTGSIGPKIAIESPTERHLQNLFIEFIVKKSFGIAFVVRVGDILIDIE